MESSRRTFFKENMNYYKEKDSYGWTVFEDKLLLVIKEIKQ